jgi:hypothetical protein
MRTASDGLSRRLRRRRQRAANSASGEQGAPANLTVRAAIETASLIIPPVSLLTVLAYWFGWSLTNTRAAYFGIDQSTLGFSTQDYLVRSADAAFVPVMVLLLAALVAVGVHRLARDTVRRGVALRALALAGVFLTGLGFIATAAGVYVMLRPFAWVHYLVPPLILGGGVLGTVYGLWLIRHAGLHRRERPSIWERSTSMLAVLVVLLTMFWASSLYAAALGRGRGQQLAGAIRERPLVTVFSSKALGIAGPGVTEIRIAEPDAAYRYRYSGLRLLIRGGNRYFMVPSGWSRQRGTVVVLEENAGIRFEFAPGGR